MMLRFHPLTSTFTSRTNNLAVNPFRPRLLALLLGLATGSTLCAQVSVNNAVYTIDQTIRQYGLISFGDASFTNYSSTWGPLAVGGDLTLSGSGSIAQQGYMFNSSDPTLYVAGDLNLSGWDWTHLQNGYASLPNLTGSWTWDQNQKRLTSGNASLSTSNTPDPLGSVDPRNNSGPADWDFATIQSELAAASTELANATATGLITLNSQTLSFNANGATDGVVVFNLDMNLFNGSLYDANGNGSWNQNQERVSQVVINVPAEVTFVINVQNADGRTIFDGINFNAGTNNDQILWNITPELNGGLGASVSLGGQSRFYGTVLAPMVDLTNSGWVSPEGQVIAATYSHSNASLNYAQFETFVSFTPVPEPRTWAGAGVAAALVSVFLQRRRRQNRAV